MSEASIVWYPLFPCGVEYKPIYMAEIFDLVYHGNGGFTWDDVWKMPVTHRRYCIRKIEEYLKKVEDQRNQAENKVTENTNMQKFKIPEHVKEASKDYSYVSNVKNKKANK